MKKLIKDCKFKLNKNKKKPKCIGATINLRLTSFLKILCRGQLALF